MAKKESKEPREPNYAEFDAIYSEMYKIQGELDKLNRKMSLLTNGVKLMRDRAETAQ